MDAHPLGNPIWSALRTAHVHLSLGDATLKAYPADVAPFAGVGTDEFLSARSLSEMLGDDASVYFLGRLPVVEAPWVVERAADLVQMTYLHSSPPPAASRGADFRELQAADADAMVALTELVFPGYFRKNTVKMGRYFGVFASGELVAMTGERLAMDGYQEVSAVCTHPSHSGRGYASALVRHVVGAILDRQTTPFLHVSPDNPRARALYKVLGFIDHGMIALAHVRRIP